MASQKYNYLWLGRRPHPFLFNTDMITCITSRINVWNALYLSKNAMMEIQIVQDAASCHLTNKGPWVVSTQCSSHCIGQRKIQFKALILIFKTFWPSCTNFTHIEANEEKPNHLNNNGTAQSLMDWTWLSQKPSLCPQTGPSTTVAFLRGTGTDHA